MGKVTGSRIRVVNDGSTNHDFQCRVIIKTLLKIHKMFNYFVIKLNAFPVLKFSNICGYPCVQICSMLLSSAY